MILGLFSYKIAKIFIYNSHSISLIPGTCFPFLCKPIFRKFPLNFSFLHQFRILSIKYAFGLTGNDATFLHGNSKDSNIVSHLLIFYKFVKLVSDSDKENEK